MCGISGVFYSSNIKMSHEEKTTHLIKSINKLKHRGPNRIDYWFDSSESIYLGHARLSILDLTEAGNQPMVSKNRRYVIVYNGEIYNHLDIRRDLIKYGHIDWNGNSDTETILNAIQYWGLEATLERTIGMFSFALWDKELDKIFLVRDRFGEKPLYYGVFEHNFIFASDLISLIDYPFFKKIVNDSVVKSYFEYNYIKTTHSIYKSVFKLEPGSILEFSTKNHEIYIKKYYDFNTIENFNVNDFSSEENILSHYEKLLHNSVKSQLISDVPIGAFLSGGIDSSAVVSIMQQYSQTKVKTFTIGFENNHFDESITANNISKYLGTDHNSFQFNAKCLHDLIYDIPNVYSEPFSDSSQLPTMLVSKFASEQVKVVLTGDGGDELFGGYNRYLYANKYSDILLSLPIIFRKVLSRIISGVSPTKYNTIFSYIRGITKSNGFLKNPGQKIHKIANFLGSESEADLYYRMTTNYDKFGIVKNRKKNLSDLDTLFKSLKLLSFSEKMMVVDILTYLTDDILCKVDRASMYYSLETRAPFLNHKLVDFVSRLPFSFKIRNNSTKWLLRQTLYKYVPEHFFNNPKSGFAIPLADLFRNSLKKNIEEILFEKNNYISEILDINKIKKAWDQHQTENDNHQDILWSVVVFKLWLVNNNIS